MPEFTNFKDAFAWWLENVYPDLPPSEKKDLRFAKFDFLNRYELSDKRIREIIEKHSVIEVMIKVEKKP